MRRDRLSRPADAGYWGQLLLSILSCWLVSSSVMMMLDPLFRFRLSAAVLVLHALLLTAVMLLVARRWWVWPAVVGVGAFLCAVFLFLTGRIPDFLAFVKGFFAWWAALFPRGSIFNTTGNIALVQWLIHIGVCAGVCLLLHGGRRVWPVAVAWCGLLTGVTIAGFEVGALAVLLGLLGLLAPAVYSLLRAHRRVLLGSGGRAALSVVAIGAAASLLAGALLPAVTPYVSELDLQKRLQKDLTAQLPFDNPLAELGLSDPSQLGGPINLEDPALVMRVVTDQPELMRVNVFTTYTGKGWQADHIERYQATADMLQQLYGAPGPAHGEARTAEVTMFTQATCLPTCGLVCNFTLSQPSLLVQCNPRGELQLPELTYTHPVYYRFSYYPLNRDLIPADHDDAGYVGELYLQLPDSLPEALAERAREVTEGGDTPYEKMQLLEEYLRQNYRYTLSPSHVPADRDFVDYFLETGEGYCVYFASAMAVLARIAGVPSRYVVGFGLEENGNSTYLARYSTAHAWVECYLGRDYGWVTFDPTAGAGFVDGVRDPQSSGDPQPVESTRPTGSASGRPLPTGTATNPNTTTASTGTDATGAPTPSSGATRPTSAAPGGDDSQLPRLLLLGIFLLVLAALVAYLAWRTVIFRTAYELSAVRLRFPDDTASQMWWYYRDVKRQMALLEHPLRKGETLRQWWTRIGPFGIPGFEQSMEAVEAALYRETDPTDAQIEAMADLHQALEQQLRERLSWRRYLWHRFFRL